MAGLVAGSHARNELHVVHGMDEVTPLEFIFLMSSTNLFFFDIFYDSFLMNVYKYFICMQHQPPTRESAKKICRICGDEIGLKDNGELFVACYECNFPVCRPCYEYERSDGNQCCPQCNTRYKRHKGRILLNYQ